MFYLSVSLFTVKATSRVSAEDQSSLNMFPHAMMYHIEQGSQLSNLSGQPPDTQYIPSWGCRPQDSATIHVHAHAHAMAECQVSCIHVFISVEETRYE